MHRVFFPHSDFSTQEILLTDEKEIHHLLNVLRLKKNDKINLFNGQNREASGTIIAINSNGVKIQINEVKKFHSQNATMILACAIPKKSKFEFIIEKTTELGVAEIIPLRTQRTEINLNEERLIKKNLRYQTVAINAAKQCRRQNIPIIHTITDFSTAIAQLSQRTTLLIPSLIEPRIPLLQALNQMNPKQNISIFIGPEGDFTPEEYALAKAKGCTAVSLGETILKVETAAIISVGCSQLFFNDHAVRT